jgi:hypothetical protein
VVEAWLERLGARPELHDKVEFAVFRTARDFTAPQALRRDWSSLLDYRTRERWEALLGQLTAPLAQRASASDAYPRLRALQANRPETSDWRRLLRDCRGGTEEFAIAARLAFVAEAQLQSAVARDALELARAACLRRSIASVSCLIAPTDGGGADDEIRHLRPGTFDITRDLHTARGGDSHREALRRAGEFRLQPREARALEALLREAGLPESPPQWLAFVRQACRAREWAKFVFTRHLAAAMEGIAHEFDAVGLGREHASWLTLAQIRSGAQRDPAARRDVWERQATSATHRHERQRRQMLGPVLAHEHDAWIADSLGVLPNFVGERSVSAPLVVLDGGDVPEARLRGATIALQQADPGYDWLFERGIRGLLTAWGGAHSHMAIRCAEFDLTAAIGCGEAVYRQALRARHVRIDPLQGSLWLQ